MEKDWVGKIVKLPKCDDVIAIPIRYSGGGYICIVIRDKGKIVSSTENYISGWAFDTAVDLTGIMLAL